jgi:trk system potassium uptake protein TrkA
VKVVVIGCGRVGSTVAVQLAQDGWDVVAVDEKEEALGRLGEDWRGGFIVGHGMDVDVLLEAGIENANAVVVATNGDNTNLVVAQVAKERFGVSCVVARILDPARAKFYSQQGVRIVCPTKSAIDALTEAVQWHEHPQETPA